MFQYYDASKREYIDFDKETNDILSNTITSLTVYRKIGDTHYLFDMGDMVQIDIIHKVKRKIRNVKEI